MLRSSSQKAHRKSNRSTKTGIQPATSRHCTRSLHTQPQVPSRKLNQPRSRPTLTHASSPLTTSIQLRHFHGAFYDSPRRDLEGKTAIVSGGSRGIGLATTKLLLSRGASVIYCSKSPQSIESGQNNILSAFPGLFDPLVAGGEGSSHGGFRTPVYLSTPSPRASIPSSSPSSREALELTPQLSQFFQGIECDVSSERSIQAFYAIVKQLKTHPGLVGRKDNHHNNNNNNHNNHNNTHNDPNSSSPTPLYSGSDLLINSAGLCQNQLLLRVSESMIDSVMKVNVNGTMLMTKYFLKQLPVFRTPDTGSSSSSPSTPHKLATSQQSTESNTNTPIATPTQTPPYDLLINNQHYYRVINISSVIGKQGNPGQSVYATSKAAVDGFTRSMSKELGAYRGAPITFNSISPGFIDTDMTAIMTPEQHLKIVDRINLKRVGQPEEIAHLIAFLASNQSSYINGQNISIDGGM